MTKPIRQWLYWTPRILSLLLLVFLATFSLDVIEPGRSAGEIAVGLLMHNIPVFVLAGVLAVSWKRELVGGAVFTVIGLLFLARAVVTLAMNGYGQWLDALLGSVPLAAPALLIGVLFLVNWRRKRAAAGNAPAAPAPEPPAANNAKTE